MTVASILFLSLITVTAFVFFLLRIMSWGTMLRFAIPIDVIFSALSLFAFGGTWSGTSVAITSGLILAVFLTLARKLEKVSRKPRFRWTLMRVEKTDDKV
jgi:hypothetical protein